MKTTIKLFSGKTEALVDYRLSDENCTFESLIDYVETEREVIFEEECEYKEGVDIEDVEITGYDRKLQYFIEDKDGDECEGHTYFDVNNESTETFVKRFFDMMAKEIRTEQKKATN